MVDIWIIGGLDVTDVRVITSGIRTITCVRAELSAMYHYLCCRFTWIPGGETVRGDYSTKYPQETRVKASV